MFQNFLVGIAFGGHYCSPDLAEADSMSPTASIESDCAPIPVRSNLTALVIKTYRFESRTLQMSFREDSPYFQFLTYNNRPLVT